MATKNGRETTKKMVQRMFETRMDLPADAREKLVALCNRQLAATFDLYSQNKHAHWNVKGRDFYQLHELFDRLAEEVLPFVDEIAERIAALGGTAQGTVRRAAGSSGLTDFPEGVAEGMAVVKEIADRYATLSADTRKAIDTAEEAEDMATSDMFTEVVRTLDKHLYFLEAHLQA